MAMGEQEVVGVSAAYSQSRRGGSSEEEEEDVCRICRTTGDKGSPLHYPCACSGSIKYVHEDCLLQWLNHTHARQCEVCKHPFTFSSVYAENAPSRLSYKEFLLGLAFKGGWGMNFFVRLTFVMSVWLIFIPFITFWMWRFTFVRSILEAQKLFVKRLTPTLLFTDCLHGFLVAAGIMLIFLGLTSLRDYFRHFRELGGFDVDREDLMDWRLGDRAGRRQGLVGDNRLDGGLRAAPPGGGDREGVGLGQGLAAGARQIMRRNAENVAPRLEMQVEQLFDGADDVDGAEDVPFDELVGMQGPVFHILENAISVLANNAIFLGLVAFLPFTLGRIVLFMVTCLISVGPSGHISGVLGMGLGMGLNSIGNIMLGPSEDMIASNDTVASNATVGAVLPGRRVPGLTNSNIVESVIASTSSNFSDAVTVAAGYAVIIVALSFHLGLKALIKYIRGEPLTMGRFQGLASLVEAASTIARQLVAGVKYMMTMLKVAFVSLIEFGVLPFLCGCWIDICTLSVLEGTVANRLAFFRASPITSALLHWLVGIVYMLHISMFASLLREVLRPGLLYFLHDPANPNYDPFHDLAEDPVHKHACRVVLSMVVYGSLVVILIFLPGKIARSIAPSLFPLNIRTSNPFTEIPADMLLFHIFMPFAMEHFRPESTIRTVLFYWFSTVARALGLTEFLLRGPEEANDQGRGGGQAPELAGGGVQGQELPVTEDAAAVEPDINDQDGSEEYIFAFRILLLLLGAWVSLLFFNSMMMVLPVSLGRAIFASISQLPIKYGFKCNDLHAFNIGCYVIWASFVVIGYAIDYLKTHNAKVLIVLVLKWTAIVAKSSMLLCLWIIVIPVLIGLLFNLLVVIPLWVSIDESPVFLLYQDWALGLVLLKIWTRLVAPLVDESWRMKFERVKADGFTRLQGIWVLREIVAPILTKLLTALCVPYIFARGLFPALGYSLIVNSAVYRFSWLGSLVLGLLWYGVNFLQQWVLELHNSILDDRYLIGKRLHNYGERTIEERHVPFDGFSESVEPIAALIDSNLSTLEQHPTKLVPRPLPDTNGIEDFADASHPLGLGRRHSSQLGTLLAASL